MTNKLLLAAIALGLWANAVATFVRPARADIDPTIAGGLGGIEGQLAVIANEVGGIKNYLLNQSISGRP